MLGLAELIGVKAELMPGRAELIRGWAELMEDTAEKMIFYGVEVVERASSTSFYQRN